MIPAPDATPFEAIIANGVEWLRLIVEACGATIIAVGVFRAIALLLRPGGPGGFNSVRLRLATYLALALEFQLGADILATTVAPSWDKIGKLGAIAVIRTALNFFLMREISLEEKASGKHPLQVDKRKGDG